MKKHLSFTMGSAQVCVCSDCNSALMIRGFFDDWDGDWYMVKDRVWHAATPDKVRFLCVGCLENRLGRRLSAKDFKRSAKVNFVGNKSPRLRSRLKGCRPAKRLRETKFKFWTTEAPNKQGRRDVRPNPAAKSSMRIETRGRRAS
jgi:hypothetical protein